MADIRIKWEAPLNQAIVDSIAIYRYDGITTDCVEVSENGVLLTDTLASDSTVYDDLDTPELGLITYGVFSKNPSGLSQCALSSISLEPTISQSPTALIRIYLDSSNAPSGLTQVNADFTVGPEALTSTLELNPKYGVDVGHYVYPFFLSQAEADYFDSQNGGSGSNHSMTYQSITYYMPDNGGTHSGSSAPSDIVINGNTFSYNKIDTGVEVAKLDESEEAPTGLTAVEEVIIVAPNNGPTELTSAEEAVAPTSGPTGISTLRSPGLTVTSSSGDITKVLIEGNGYFIQNGALYATDNSSTRELVPEFSSGVLDVDGGAWFLGVLKTNGDLHYQEVYSYLVGGPGGGTFYKTYNRLISGVSKFALSNSESSDNPRNLLMIMSDGSLQTFRTGGMGPADIYGVDVLLIDPYETLPSGSGVVEVFTNKRNSYILKSDGTLHSSGSNQNGMLGNGTTSTVGNTSTQTIISDYVQIADSVADVVVSDTFAGLLKTDGSMYTWGNDSLGVLGNGTGKVNKTIPSKIFNAGEVQQMAIGEAHMLVLKTDGSVHGWGAMTRGQLGNGLTTGYLETPDELFPSSLGITKIWGGQYSGGYTTPTGTYLFGQNGNGELSLGDSEPFGQTTTIVSGVHVITTALISEPTLLQESTSSFTTSPTGITAVEEEVVAPTSGPTGITSVEEIPAPTSGPTELTSVEEILAPSNGITAVQAWGADGVVSRSQGIVYNWDGVGYVNGTYSLRLSSGKWSWYYNNNRMAFFSIDSDILNPRTASYLNYTFGWNVAGWFINDVS